jgi:hypothetical protein
VGKIFRIDFLLFTLAGKGLCVRLFSFSTVNDVSWFENWCRLVHRARVGGVRARRAGDFFSVQYWEEWLH